MTKLNVDELFELIAQLRHPETGCPWDREQALHTMAKPVVSEAKELAEELSAVNKNGIIEEAGDVLWNLVTVLSIAEEQGLFTPQDIVKVVAEKMVGR
ncbi:MAG: nucleoside triphosphate pyrophosphohydrolase, partial [Planctomycetes bacterium]|nr:nucleoside triphosphate pyrophosphohydrolase [Planctomycetota bacterium]